MNSYFAIFLACFAVGVSATASVDLGTAAHFAILSGAGITNIPTSHIVGDIGTHPITGAALTGFGLTEIVGSVFCVDAGYPNANVAIEDPVALLAAKADLQIAYNDARDRTPVPTGEFLNPGDGNIGGLNLGPGLYKFTAQCQITGSDVTLTGGADDVWIFQVGSLANIGTGIKVLLAGGARAENVFWQTGSAFTASADAVIQGTILAYSGATFAARCTVNGRILTNGASVTLSMINVNLPGAATSTDAPVVSTDAPVVSTDAPVVSTEAPVVSTEAPVVSTAAPVVSTEAPVVSTDAPVVSTEAPVVSTETPVVSTEAPVVSTEAPVVATAEPTADPALRAVVDQNRVGAGADAVVAPTENNSTSALPFVAAALFVCLAAVGLVVRQRDRSKMRASETLMRSLEAEKADAAMGFKGNAASPLYADQYVEKVNPMYNDDAEADTYGREQIADGATLGNSKSISKSLKSGMGSLRSRGSTGGGYTGLAGDGFVDNLTEDDY